MPLTEISIKKHCSFFNFAKRLNLSSISTFQSWLSFVFFFFVFFLFIFFSHSRMKQYTYVPLLFISSTAHSAMSSTTTLFIFIGYTIQEKKLTTREWYNFGLANTVLMDYLIIIQKHFTKLDLKEDLITLENILLKILLSFNLRN